MQPNNTFQRIELYLSGRNLKDMDVFSKSDPYIKVSYRRDFNCKNYVVLGKTQTIENNLNPNFTTPFPLDYVFQSRQDIKFQVFDDDSGNDDFIGSVQTTVGALMGAKHQTSILQLKNQQKNTGKIIVRCEKVNSSNQFYIMKWKAKKLMNTDSYFDFWDKSDPYIKLLKIREDNSLILCHQTQWIKDNLNPSWNQFTVPANRLHDENSSKFKVQCWDYEKDANHQFIGQAYLEVQDLMNKSIPYPRTIQLFNPKSKKPGNLILQQFECIIRPTFLDHLKGGLELNMVIAIDFTGSNGSPTQPSSLHYMDPHKPNQYQTAIHAISSILLNYDSDKKIPAFGFGADLKFPTMSGLSHCFPLSGDFNNVNSEGIDDLMRLYQQSLTHLTLSGPTYFAPIISQVSKIAAGNKMSENYTYQVLLILTDGEIHDMQKVVDLIISCSDLPMSIIIVGIGNADFGNMERLDGDSGLYGSNGQKAKRDIVQFVPFRNVNYNPEVLSQHLLAELPNQVVSYFESQKISPRIPPPQQNMSELFLSQQKNVNPYGSS